MAGPLTTVGTLTGAISLNISRVLRWGNGITMKFQVPNQNEVGGLETVLELTKDFNRVALDETVSGDSKTVIYRVADTGYDLDTVLRNKNLHITADGLTISELKVEPLAPNEAQIYTITGKVRTLRANFDNR